MSLMVQIKLNYCLSAGNLKNNGLLRKKNTKGVILQQKGTRMAEDGEDWNWLEIVFPFLGP